MSKLDLGHSKLEVASTEVMQQPESTAGTRKRALLVGVAVTGLTVTLLWLSVLYLAIKAVIAIF
jgi:hypothetical protein